MVEKPITFRPTPKAGERIAFEKKKHPKKSSSEIINELLEKAIDLEAKASLVPPEGTNKEEFLKSIQKNDPAYVPAVEPSKEDNKTCIYYSSPKQGVVACQKDFTKKGKIYTITEEECQTCWKRRSYVRRKQKTIDTSKPMECARDLRIFPTNMGVACYQICKHRYPNFYNKCEARKRIEQARTPSP